MSTKGVNKVIIIGNLGGDPEVRFMPNGTAVANFTVATSEAWKDKQTGEQKEKTEWHRIVIYQRLAEIAGEYLRKGAKVYLEGKLHTRKWQNQQGQDQYTTEVIVNNMQMLDRAGGAQQQANNRQQNQGGFNQQQNHNQSGFNQQQNNNQHQNNQRPQKVNPQEPTIDFDDDIPF